tara:strand:- start:1150 stop:1638 length:489 start_codon:yes stop_codon:yes gene_type:complete
MKNSQTNKDNDSQSFGINQPFHSADAEYFFLGDIDPEEYIDDYNREKDSEQVADNELSVGADAGWLASDAELHYNREKDSEQIAQWEEDMYKQMYLDSIARNTPLKEYKVMHSNAGYYIGTSYEENVGDGMHPIYVEFPFERLSGYYPTKELASQSLINYNI